MSREMRNKEYNLLTSVRQSYRDHVSCDIAQGSPLFMEERDSRFYERGDKVGMVSYRPPRNFNSSTDVLKEQKNIIFGQIYDEIVAYQIAAKSRPLLHYSFYSTRNLLCEYIKKWLVDIKELPLDSKGLLLTVTEHQAFMSSCHDNRIFSSSQVLPTMQSTLGAIRTMLLSLQQVIEKEISEKGLQEIINDIAKYLRGSVRASIQYLYYSAQQYPSKGVLITLPKLMSPDAALDKPSRTRHFKLIQALLSSRYVSGSFGLEVSRFISPEARFADISISSDDTSPSPSGKEINDMIGGNLLPDPSMLRKMFPAFNSGIIKKLARNREALNNYLNIFDLIVVLSELQLRFESFRNIINYFGEFIHVDKAKYLFEMLNDLSVKIIESLEFALHRHNVFISEPSSSSSDKDWNNYHLPQAQSAYDNIILNNKMAILAVTDLLHKIHFKYTENHHTEMIGQLQEAVGGLVILALEQGVNPPQGLLTQGALSLSDGSMLPIANASQTPQAARLVRNSSSVFSAAPVRRQLTYAPADGLGCS